MAVGGPLRELSFVVGEIEMDKIQAVFTELKLITGLKKAELYGKALEWSLGFFENETLRYIAGIFVVLDVLALLKILLNI